MNQETIGKFIATCRKEKQLTQMQLAKKLGITNRAVSKWETGKSIPDASIMLELCNVLGITVNELLCGERIEMEEYQLKAENNLVALFKGKENRKKLTLVKIVGELLIISGIIIFLFFPDIYKPELQYNILMRVMGVFIFGCGTTISYYTDKIRKELTI
jgi:transcriptional regulator with XRE-family HTH domain